MSARRLALRIFIVLMTIVAAVSTVLWVALDQSDTAKQKAGQAAVEVDRVDEHSSENRRRALENRRLIMANRRLVIASRRLSQQNRRILERFARLLVQARIAERARGGIKITQTARRGATGATGPRGLAGAAAKAITSTQLAEALRPLLPAIVESYCSGGACAGRDGSDGTNGVDAPPPTQEQVTEGLRLLCGAEIVCTAPGPVGPQGPPSPPIPCSQQPPELGYQCGPPPETIPAP